MLLHLSILPQSNIPTGFFDGDEFAWTDSAYPVTMRSIPVHK
jgi:hypothetical protein